MLSIKNLKKFATLGAIASMCSFAKAEEQEFVPAGEIKDAQIVNGTVMVHSDGAEIAGVQTPYTFMPTNTLTAGFAPAAISNATSVVSDTNGTCFATTDDGKVFKFTVGEQGIPSIPTQMAFKTVDNAGNTNDLGKTVTLAAAKDGKVFGTYETFLAKFKQEGTNLVESTTTKLGGTRVLSHYNGKNISVLNSKGKAFSFPVDNIMIHESLNGTTPSNPTVFVARNGEYFAGNEEGKVGTTQTFAPVSGLSVIDNEVYAASPSTNELKCVSNINLPNITVDTKHGVVKVLDNPAKKNTLYFVTTNSVGKTNY